MGGGRSYFEFAGEQQEIVAVDPPARFDEMKYERTGLARTVASTPGLVVDAADVITRPPAMAALRRGRAARPVVPLLVARRSSSSGLGSSRASARLLDWARLRA